MAGIERIKIKSSWNDWRTKMAEDLSPAASALYHSIFQLLPDNSAIICTKEEAQSRYDWQEGIDVILHFADGTKATLQEKFLDFTQDTITFEEIKTSGEKGAWYYCTAQYYFVGYARKYKTDGLLQFQSYVLIDLPGLHREDHKSVLRWYKNVNKNDGRASTFRYLYFRDIPESVTVDMFPAKLPKDKTSNQPDLFGIY